MFCIFLGNPEKKPQKKLEGIERNGREVKRKLKGS